MRLRNQKPKQSEKANTEQGKQREWFFTERKVNL